MLTALSKRIGGYVIVESPWSKLPKENISESYKCFRLPNNLILLGFRAPGVQGHHLHDFGWSRDQDGTVRLEWRTVWDAIPL